MRAHSGHQARRDHGIIAPCVVLVKMLGIRCDFEATNRKGLCAAFLTRLSHTVRLLSPLKNSHLNIEMRHVPVCHRGNSNIGVIRELEIQISTIETDKSPRPKLVNSRKNLSSPEFAFLA